MIEHGGMDVIQFNHVASSEKNARRFFLGFCWKNHQRFCPRCRERKLYHVEGRRRRCSRCHYTFHDFSQRFIKGCAFSAQQWLWFLKLYELGVPSKELGKQLQVSYVTILKAKDILRRAILAQALDADRYYERGIWPGPGRGKTIQGLHKAPVFGVMDLNGYVICDLLPDLAAENILHFKLNFRLKTASQGQVVYTSPYQQYTSLVTCGPELWPTRFIHHDDTRIPLDTTGFWQFVKQRLRSLRGVTQANFALYLKEWELRYNHRQEDLLSVLAGALCGFVPVGPMHEDVESGKWKEERLREWENEQVLDQPLRRIVNE